MAIANIPQTSKLQIKVQTGTNSSGKAVCRVRAYTVKSTAPASDVHAVGQSLAALQAYPLVSIGRQDDGLLLEQ